MKEIFEATFLSNELALNSFHYRDFVPKKQVNMLLFSLSNVISQCCGHHKRLLISFVLW